MKVKWTIVLLVAGIVLVGAVSAWGATLEVGPGKTYSTIQAAINAANDGDTVWVANGTYTETLDITKNITLEGESEAGVLIDTSTFNDYGISVSGDLTVTLKDFTVKGPAPAAYGYGIKVSGENADITIHDVTVKDSGRSGIDLNGVARGDLKNITVIDNGGAGLALTDSSNVTVDGITTSGNAWGGMAVYTYGRYYTGGANNIALTGMNSFSEATGLYTEIENYTDPAHPYPITNLNIPTSEFSYTVSSNTHPNVVAYYPNLTTASGAAVAGDPNNAFINDRSTGDFVVVPGLKVQSAVLAAHNGDKVVVEPGTYTEGSIITKDLNLIGSGSGTIIQSPVSLTTFFTTSAKNYPIILVQNSATAAISNLVVDGLGRGNGNYRFVGIAFYNAGGSVDNVEIKGIRNTPFSGAQHGVAIYAFNSDGTPRTLLVQNSNIHDFQKNGMSLNGAGLTVDVHGNTVTGVGPTPIIAQNGIQVGTGAGGTIQGNTVTGIWYTGGYWGSSGILLYAPASGMSVTGNDVVGCQLGIPGYWADNLQILRNNIRGSEWGIDLYETHGAKIHYNAITGSTQAALWTNHPADATLNWWGSATGPAVDTNDDQVADYGGTGGLISATGDFVIFSPWLGIAPDGDPTTPGVQITGPMTIIVAPVGPAPAGGYLNTAIAGANSPNLPYADTIEVKHGTYDASTPITQPVSILSQHGSAANTHLNGNMSLNARNIIIGRMRQGFSIHGNVTVGAGVDTSTIHINWNDIYGMVINNGTGTLDATYNYWDGNTPWTKTTGVVDYYPYLPNPAGVIIGYIDSLHLTPDDAITYANLTNGGLAGPDALTVLQLMHTYGFSQEEAQQLVREYGRVRIHLAMMGASTLHQFSINLLGYGTSAGGGGSILDHQIAGGGGSINGVTLSASYVQGEPVHIAFTLTDPITGKVVTNAIATLSVVKTTPGKSTSLVFWGMIPYNNDVGQYTFNYDTTKLTPGYYDLYIGTSDGQTRQFRIEITAP